jgi:hypothetical protein
MNNQFDELTRSIAQSVTRRGALKKFGVGLASMALTCFGLANKAEAARCARYWQPCATHSDCCSRFCRYDGLCGCTSKKDCPVKTSCNLGICMGGF